MSKNSFKNLGVFILFLAFLPLSFANAEVRPSTFQYVKSIILPANILEKQYVKVDIDAEASSHTLSTLGDLRVVANAFEEIPFQVVVENEQTRRESTEGQIYDLSSQGGKTTFVVDIKEANRIHDHLQIVTDSKNFKRKVSIFASDTPFPVGHDGWRLLSDNGYIYNFHDDVSGFDSGSGEVSYPQNTFRYLEVEIGDGEGETVSVKGVKLFRLVEKKQREYATVFPVSVKQNTERKTTELTIDTGITGVPTRQVVLRSNQDLNFSRRVVVQSSNDRENWSLVGEGYLFHLNTPLFAGSQLSLTYQETRARYLRIVVQNNDDIPVSFDAEAEVSGVVRSLVFQADPEKSYQLYYGNSSASAPHYDLAQYFQYIESTSLLYAYLGVEAVNPVFETTPVSAIPFTERNTILLNGVLILLAVFVTYLILSYLRRLKLSARGSNNKSHGINE